MAAWTKKSGTIPDKVTAILVYNTDDSEPNLIMAANTKTIAGFGITTPSGVPDANATTSGEWGFGIGGKNMDFAESGAFSPDYYEFIDGTQGGLPAWNIRTTSEATTIMYLFNNITLLSDNPDRLLTDVADSTGIAISQGDDFWTIGRGGSPEIVTDCTTAYVTATPLCIAATMRRVATVTDNELFYSTKASGTMASISSAVNNPETAGNGNNASLTSFGDRAGGYAFNAEVYMFILANESKLTTGEMDTIIADPLGTLVDTGAGGATTSDVNLHGTGRGISRGVARGIG